MRARVTHNTMSLFIHDVLPFLYKTSPDCFPSALIITYNQTQPATSANNNMCPQCPPVSAAEAPTEMQELKTSMEVLTSAIGEALVIANELEEGYRKSGIYYHTSQAAARMPANFPQDRLTQLAGVFETSTTVEYAAIFAKLHNVIASLTNLRSAARSHGTVEELSHRVFHELAPAWEVLETELLAIGTEFDDYADSAHTLFDISRAYHETDHNGVRCAWYDPCAAEIFDGPIPYCKGEEWDKFRQWVWSLPETQRSVEAGRTVDEVALSMLWDEPEGFEAEV